MSKPGYVFDGAAWQPFSGPAGPPGPGLSLKGTVAGAAFLPPASAAVHAGDCYIADDTGHVWVFNGATSKFEDFGPFKGAKGDPGQTLTIAGAVQYPRDLPATPTNLSVFMATGGSSTKPEPGHLFIYQPTSLSASGDPVDAVFDPPKGYVDLGAIAGPQGLRGVQGVQGDPGPAAHFLPSVATMMDLPATGKPGELCITENNGHVYGWDVTLGRWEDGGQIRIDGKHAHLAPSVATEADLPLEGTPGEWRVVEDAGHIVGWDAENWTWVDGGEFRSMPPGVEQGDILYWDTGLGEWLRQPNRMGSEINVLLNEDDGVPVYDQTNDEFEVRRLNMGDLGDGPGALVPQDGQSLIFNNGFWTPNFRPSAILFVGNGDIDDALIGSEDDDYGMPPLTVPSPSDFPPIAGDQYLDLDSGEVTEFTGTGAPAPGRGGVAADGISAPRPFSAVRAGSIAGSTDFDPPFSGMKTGMGIVWSEGLNKFTAGSPNTTVVKWDATTTYSEGALVVHNGDAYLLKHATSLNMEPGSDADLAAKHWLRATRTMRPWEPGKTWRAGDIVIVPESNNYLTSGSLVDFDGGYWSTRSHLWIATDDIPGSIPIAGIEPVSVSDVPPGYTTSAAYPPSSASASTPYHTEWSRLDAPTLHLLQSKSEMVAGSTAHGEAHFIDGDRAVVVVAGEEGGFVWRYMAHSHGFDSAHGRWQRTTDRWPAPPVPVAAEKDFVLTVEEVTAGATTYYRGVWKAAAAGGLAAGGTPNDHDILAWNGPADTGGPVWVDPIATEWNVALQQSIASLEHDSQMGYYALSNRIDGVVSGLTRKDSVKSKDANTPPANPVAGDQYILGPAPTGDWAGEAHHHATFDGAKWVIEAPVLHDTRMAEDTQIMWSWNGTSWVNVGKAGAQHLRDMQDVTIAAPEMSDLLAWNATSHKWVNVKMSAFKAGDLADVDYSTAPANKQTLVYDDADGKWKPSNIAVKIADAEDVVLTTPANGQGLYYDLATKTWKNGKIKLPLGDLSDVSAGTVKSGDVLTWDSTARAWMPKQPAAGTGAGAGAVAGSVDWTGFGQNSVVRDFPTVLIDLPANTWGRVEQEVEFACTTLTNNGLLYFKPTFKPATPIADLKPHVLNGGWNARSGSSYEQAESAWWKIHSTSTDKIDLGYTGVGMSSGWAFGVNEPASIKFTLSSGPDIRQTVLSWRTVHQYGKSSYPTEFEGRAILDIPIWYFAGFHLSPSGQECKGTHRVTYGRKASDVS